MCIPPQLQAIDPADGAAAQSSVLPSGVNDNAGSAANKGKPAPRPATASRLQVSQQSRRHQTHQRSSSSRNATSRRPIRKSSESATGTDDDDDDDADDVRYNDDDDDV